MKTDFKTFELLIEYHKQYHKISEFSQKNSEFSSVKKMVAVKQSKQRLRFRIELNKFSALNWIFYSLIHFKHHLCKTNSSICFKYFAIIDTTSHVEHKKWSFTEKRPFNLKVLVWLENWTQEIRIKLIKRLGVLMHVYVLKNLYVLKQHQETYKSPEIWKSKKKFEGPIQLEVQSCRIIDPQNQREQASDQLIILKTLTWNSKNFSL